MGSALGKDAADATTGLTAKDKRYIRDVWRTFTTEHEDYGVILFTSLFVKHPDYQQLFTHFRDKSLINLRGDPKFRAHASIVGSHISTMVNALDSPQMLLGVVEKNAKFHAQLVSRVRPEHFVEMGRVIIDVLCANYEELMTPAAVNAWEKLFQLMNEKNVAVYAAEPADTNTADSYKLQCMSTTAILARGNVPSKGTDNQRPYSQGPPKTSEKSSRMVKSPDVDVLGGSSSDEQPSADGEVPRDKGQQKKPAASERAAPKPAAVTDVVNPSAAANGAVPGPSATVSPTGKERRRKSAAPGKAHPRANKAGHGAVAEGAAQKQPPELSAKGKEAAQKPKTSDKSSHRKQDQLSGDKPPLPSSSEPS